MPQEQVDKRLGIERVTWATLMPTTIAAVERLLPRVVTPSYTSTIASLISMTIGGTTIQFQVNPLVE